MPSLNTGNAILSNAIAVDSSYNVGIGGAASGSFKLQVTGTSNLTGALTGTSATFSSSVTATSAFFNASNGFGLAARNAANTQYRNLIILNSGNQIEIGRDTDISQIRLGTASANDALTIASNGAATFSSSVTAGGLITKTAGSAAALLMNDTSGNNKWEMGWEATSNNFYIYSYGGGISPFRITSGGVVGIGATPASQNSGAYAGSAEMAGILRIQGVGGRYFTSGDGMEISKTSIYSYNRGTGSYNNIGINDAMTIVGGGNVLIGVSSTGAYLDGQITASVPSGTAPAACFKNLTSGQFVASFWNSASSGDNSFQMFLTDSSPTSRGTISYNRTAGLVAYNTTSDYRLKSEIEDFNALNIISNLKPKEFRVGNAIDKSIGFIAHELQEYYPQAVSGQKDAIDKDGKPIYQGVDYSQLTGLLVKAIQELNQKVNDQQQTINSLINR